MLSYFQRLMSKYQNSIFILLMPLAANLIFNIYKGEFFFGFQNSSSMMELLNFFLAGLIFLVYFFLGVELKKILKTNLITTSIAVLWVCIFFLDNILSFFPIAFSFKSHSTIISILILCLLKIRGSKYIDLARILFLVLFLRLVFYVLNFEFENLFLEQINLYTSDEDRLWYPAVSEIFNTNYRNILTNNPYPGYGLFTAYVGELNSFLLLILLHTHSLSRKPPSTSPTCVLRFYYCGDHLFDMHKRALSCIKYILLSSKIYLPFVLSKRLS